MPATLSLDDQFHGLLSLFGLQADEIQSVRQVANLDGLEAFIEAQNLLTDNVEHLDVKDVLAFNAELVLSWIRINACCLPVF